MPVEKHHKRIEPVIRRLAKTGMSWAEMARAINDGSALNYGEGDFWEVTGQYLYSVAVRAGIRKPRTRRCRHCPQHCDQEAVKDAPVAAVAVEEVKRKECIYCDSTGKYEEGQEGCDVPAHGNPCYTCHECE
jgi:hypothetical protein